jgi:hypothetical protein
MEVHPRTGHESPEGESSCSYTLSFTSALEVVNRHRITPGKQTQEAGWACGPILTDAENLAPTGIRSTDRPARGESLYRLSYPARQISK